MSYLFNIYKHTFINKFSMFIFALLPMLAWYKTPFPVSLGYTLILLLSMYIVLRKGLNITILPVSFGIICVYICFMWMYNHNFGLWTLFPPGGWIFFIFLLALFGGINTFDLVLLRKYMRWVVLISGVLFWIQLILVVSTGSPKFCFVPNLTGAFTYEGLNYSDIVSIHLNGKNPSSIFLEKSYLAYYFMTYLVLIWFDVNKKEKLFSKEIVFVIATLIASRSGTAVVGFIVLFAIKMCSMFWTANLKKRMLLIILMFPLVIGSVYIYARSEMGQQMLSRTEELSDDGTSGFSRVVAGYLMFEQLTPGEKVFGIPDARSRFGFERLDGKFVFYVNGIQTILLNLGYVGLLLYFLFYAGIFRNVSIASRMCIVVLFVMSLLESNYLNPYMTLLTIIPCAEAHQKRYERKYENYHARLRYSPRSN